MGQRTKPVFLIIAGVLLTIVALIFAFLLIQANGAVNKNISDEATKIQVETTSSTIKSTDPTEETVSETTTETSIDNVIRAKGLHRDKKNKVYDKAGNKYTTNDNSVAIVYLGTLYKVPVDSLEVKETKKKSKTKETTAPTSAPQRVDTPTPNGGNVHVSQKENVEKPKVEDAEKEEVEVKMNYSLLVVKPESVFSLTLTGADGAVEWSYDESMFTLYQANGNQCTFIAKKRGIRNIFATHKGRDYLCVISVE